MTALAQPKLNLEGYLAWEELQPERHEFYRGEVFAMVGARRIHGRVVNNLASELSFALKSTPCQVFHEGMKLQIADDTSFRGHLTAGGPLFRCRQWSNRGRRTAESAL